MLVAPLTPSPVPVLPVSLKNYGLSLTSVPFSSFMLSAAIGEAPGTMLLVWTGSSTQDLVGLLHGGGEVDKGGGAGSADLKVWVTALGFMSLVCGIGIFGTRIHRHLRSLELKSDQANAV